MGGVAERLDQVEGLGRGRVHGQQQVDPLDPPVGAELGRLDLADPLDLLEGRPELGQGGLAERLAAADGDLGRVEGAGREAGLEVGVKARRDSVSEGSWALTP